MTAATSATAQRFTEQLRQANLTQWEQAVGHRFVQELFAGTVPDAVMTQYLIQDHRFLDSFLTLLGGAIATADTFEARLRFGRFAGMVSGDENTYFLRAFEALGVTEAQRQQTPDAPATQGFSAIMREAAASRDYTAILAVLNVAEWLYQDWATRAPAQLPGSFVYTEWVTLHDNPFFNEFVAFLRGELDRVGPGNSALAHDFFQRAIGLELAFFDEAYQLAA